MEKLDVICWLWGKKYGSTDVARLERQVSKNLKLPHAFHVFTDRDIASAPFCVHRIKDTDLLDRNCFCRLRMFDPQWQKENGLTGWIWSLDLDLVITGPLDDLVSNPPADFMILKGVNAVNPNPLNGSMMLLKAGAHPEVWSEFSVEAASKIEYHEFPDDQGWIWHMLPNAFGWEGGKSSGVYAYRKPGWPGGYTLPPGAKIVAFIGKYKPNKNAGLSWVKRYWAEA